MAKVSMKPLYKEMLSGLTVRANRLKDKDITPRLAIVTATACSEASLFIKNLIKAIESVGLKYKIFAVNEDTIKEEFKELLLGLDSDTSFHGILVVEPLPDQLERYRDEIGQCISQVKDIDCMSPESIAASLYHRNKKKKPCRIDALTTILDRLHVTYSTNEILVLCDDPILNSLLANNICSSHGTYISLSSNNSRNISDIQSNISMLINMNDYPLQNIVFEVIKMKQEKQAKMKEKAILKGFAASGYQDKLTIIDAGIDIRQNKVYNSINIPKETEKNIKMYVNSPNGFGLIIISMMIRNLIIGAEQQQ